MKSVTRYLMNFILFILPPTRWFGVKRLFVRLAGVDVASNVNINGMTTVFGSGNLTIRGDTWIGIYNKFYTSSSGDILIGARCDIGPDVIFISGSHELGTANQRAGKGVGGDIIVKDGCWIGARVTILSGVTIGRGVVIGAGSLVNRDIPDNCIYAGVPARLIRKLSDT